MSKQSTPEFRVATLDDYPAIERMLTDSRLPLDGVHDLLRSGDSRMIVAIAASSSDVSDIVAVAGLEVCCEHALLRSVAVRKDWQSKGLGSELVKRVVCEAEANGIHALYLLTQTAEHYFPKFGFVPVARSEVPAPIADTVEFKSACDSTAIAMTRSLVAS